MVFCLAQKKTPVMELANMLTKSVEKHHFAKKTLDKEASVYIYNTFLESVDSWGSLFTKDDLKELEAYKEKLHTAIANQDPTFINKVQEVIVKDLKELESMFEGMRGNVPDLMAKDTFFYDTQNPYQSKERREKRWLSKIKIDILRDYVNSFDSLSQVTEITKEKAEAIFKKRLDKEQGAIKKRLEASSSIMSKVDAKLLSAITSAFDPHTSYFSPPDKEEFIEMLSKAKTAFGINCYENEDGEIEIDAVAPGSSAWSSGEINEGDVILSVTTPDGKESDFLQMSLKEINEFMLSPKVIEGKFKIRKKGGKEVVIDLVKTRIQVDENVIDSYILEGEKRIGYIALPSFYGMEGGGLFASQGCANDIAKEIIQLQKEGIDGLIFDLRNNGGGSMSEAIKLVGMFINYGAITVMSEFGKEPYTMKDVDKGTIYDGPMVVLVNRYSASASELFSATMQDYNRALIVGGDTYGKSTAQMVLPIEAYMYERPWEKNSKVGFVKLTTGAFFRCTGKTHQGEGVKADILLPDIFNHVEVGEAFEDNALKITPVDKKTYYYPLSPLPIKPLHDKSIERVNGSEEFKKITASCEKYAQTVKAGYVPADFDSYITYLKNMKVMDNGSETHKSGTILVKIPEYANAIGKLSEVYKKYREEVVKDLSNDTYLKETLNIIIDLIKIK